VPEVVEGEQQSVQLSAALEHSESSETSYDLLKAPQREIRAVSLALESLFAAKGQENMKRGLVEEETDVEQEQGCDQHQDDQSPNSLKVEHFEVVPAEPISLEETKGGLYAPTAAIVEPDLLGLFRVGDGNIGQQDPLLSDTVDVRDEEVIGLLMVGQPNLNIAQCDQTLMPTSSPFEPGIEADGSGDLPNGLFQRPFNLRVRKSITSRIHQAWGRGDR
jgi:hypothetical protein